MALSLAEFCCVLELLTSHLFEMHCHNNILSLLKFCCYSLQGRKDTDELKLK